MLTLPFHKTPLFRLFIIPDIFFSRPISQNPSVLVTDSHLLNLDVATDQYSTRPTSNCVDNPVFVNKTLVSSPRQDPRFSNLATHNLNSSTQTSDERLCKEFHSLKTLILEIKFDITSYPFPSSHTSYPFALMILKFLTYWFLI